jgi:hypothetical protein
VGGWHDLIVGRIGRRADGPQKLVEELGPILNHEAPIARFTELPAGSTIGIAVDDDDRAIIGFAARLGFGKLGRVKRAVAAAADDDDVSQRISLPPSITTVVPVT